MRRALRFLGRWLYRAFYLVLALALLVSLLALGGQILDRERALPGILGYSQLVVISGSMQPAIDPGDLLIIKRQESYKPGDVVTFLQGDSLVTHRLTGISGDAALTRGDANNTDDAPVPLEDIQGRMVLRVPRLGYAVLYLRTQQGLLMLTALFILLIAVPYLLGDREKRAARHEGKERAQ